MTTDADIAPFLAQPSIYPAQARPFYIVAPPYVRTSAGVRALHLLCHHLNALGCAAYMVIHPQKLESAFTHPGWNTPLLDAQTARHHFQAGLTPVAVYPETIQGNPLAAPVVMRYVLNYPGLIGGDAAYDASELVYGYSKKLAQAAGRPDCVLFMPLSDPSQFTPPLPGLPRSGSCFWASKYQRLHGQKLLPVTRDARELTRDRPTMSQGEIADIFRRSELFYAYENTALIIEAVLCGCPAVCLPNAYFTELIGVEELGQDGIAWGDAPEEIARARATVDRARSHYLTLNGQYWRQLQAMVNACEARAAATAYSRPLRTTLLRTRSRGARLAILSYRTLQRRGVKGSLRKALAVIRG